jgi:hypothetical protein
MYNIGGFSRNSEPPHYPPPPASTLGARLLIGCPTWEDALDEGPEPLRWGWNRGEA